MHACMRMMPVRFTSRHMGCIDCFRRPTPIRSRATTQSTGTAASFRATRTLRHHRASIARALPLPLPLHLSRARSLPLAFALPFPLHLHLAFALPNPAPSPLPPQLSDLAVSLERERERALSLQPIRLRLSPPPSLPLPACAPIRSVRRPRMLMVCPNCASNSFFRFFAPQFRNRGDPLVNTPVGDLTPLAQKHGCCQQCHQQKQYGNTPCAVPETSFATPCNTMQHPATP